ncbi:MAG: competence/damage-inducible protein A [Bacteroidales bacterium]|nr:competence/damage-inducible protein A [Bacteroidales bacterium]MCF8333418.1 competence/damage-inducible protein A [Bacteroidales bacterium]
MVNSKVKTEIINIGDEILIGQIVNTNAAWMADQLNLNGFSVVHMATIADTKEAIIQALRQASVRADVVLLTGGLGPTKDDITKQTLAEYFGTNLITHKKILQEVKDFFASRGQSLTPTNRRQADIPANCIPLSNPYGTAPGMWFEERGKIYASMPGVPIEMKNLLSREIIPRLREKYQTEHLVHQTIMTHGLGESHLSDNIREWEEQLPNHIKLAYLPRPGIVRLRLSAVGNDKTKLKQEINQAIHDLQAYIPDLIYGYDDITLEEVTGQLLSRQKKTVATAESCTGGAIAARITRIPGSSAYFRGSVVAYANDVKEKQLGVPPSSLKNHGAVSQPVVEAMAEGVRNRFKTDYALATSGIAGPEGGTKEKPVGMVWIAVSSGAQTVAREFHFGNNRERNTELSVLSALNMLRKELIGD